MVISPSCKFDQCPPAIPTLLKFFLESLGSFNIPTTPATKAIADARAKAGMFPFPKRESHGPAPRAMITYIDQKPSYVSRS